MSEGRLQGASPSGSGYPAQPEPLAGLGPSGGYPSRDVLVNEKGEVAILYSPGYGAGWLSWSSGEDPTMAYDQDLASAVQAGNFERAEQIAAEKWPDNYAGGVRDLRIEWMRPGSTFRIEEHDGNERIYYGPDDLYAVPHPAPAIETEGEDAKRLSAEHERAIDEVEAPDPEIQGIAVTESICLDRLKKQNAELREALRPFAEAVYDLGGVTEVSMTQPYRQDWLRARTLLSQSSEGGGTE